MSPLGRLLGRGDPHSLAAPYALDALEPAERVRFERHLDGCSRCTGEARRLAEDAVRLAWTAAAPPPPELRDRVLSAVRATPQEAPGARQHALPPHSRGTRQRSARSRAPRPRPLAVPFATATAAAALVVAALFAVQADRTQGRLDAERARSDGIAEVLAAPDARAATGSDDRGHALSVVASAETGSAVVTLSGYGDPPPGRVRQLWLVRPGARPRSLGLLDGDTPLVATGLQQTATSLAVTVEPDGGSLQPTGQPVFQLALESVGFGE
ncbi:anti-sigma factor domain-containing protein [Streptomyces sp. MS06]|uniref:anti-sigma factor n=1 Tax=Streptomyces sp. MS06 TaxID=3385974 RepID=UPI0039A18BFE